MPPLLTCKQCNTVYKGRAPTNKASIQHYSDSLLLGNRLCQGRELFRVVANLYSALARQGRLKHGMSLVRSRPQGRPSHMRTTQKIRRFYLRSAEQEHRCLFHWTETNFDSTLVRCRLLYTCKIEYIQYE